MKKLLIIISCLSCLHSFAQPTAAFTSNVTSGCVPQTVHFTDQSTGDPKYWNWDFGNGQLSTIKNGVATYTVPGTYTVTLVVRNADGTNAITKTDYITIFPSPAAKFTVDYSVGCNPVTVHFTDQSTSSAGAITNWEWNFGDNSPKDPTPSPTHTYTTSGFYTVSLTVTSSNGCTNTAAYQRLIRVVQGIKVDFTDKPSTSCKPPYNIPLTNTTTGPGTLNYTWNLGNGSSSNQEDVTATYSAPGTYTVMLSAVSNLGCKDSIQKTITVNPFTSSFSLNSPDTVCPNQGITFTNTSSPKPTTFSWDFGDGTVLGAQQPTKSYADTGVYVVKLLNDYTNCKDTVQKTITVSNHISTDFTATNNLGCKIPLVVQFNCPTPGVSDYFWDFGDGATGSGPAPSHTYTVLGNYNVTLTIQTTGGCQATITKSRIVQISPGNLFVTNLPVDGCVPYTFSPAAFSTTPDPIATYAWNFGDGPGVNTSPSPSHTYSSVGTYTIKLDVVTSGGCSLSVIYPNAVKVGTPPTSVDFTTVNPNPCTSAAIQFLDQTVPPATEWIWDFGDGTRPSGEQNPLHNFADTGTFTVTLFAKNNGCGKKVVKPNFIHVIAPLARFTYAVANCANPLGINFTNTSKVDPALGAVSYLWQFGDPANSTATGLNASFTYPDTGTYIAKLQVTNGTCTHTFFDTLRVYLPRADFSVSKTAVCKFEKFILKATGDTSVIASYSWSFNGGTPVNRPYQIDTSFAPTGTYSITLNVMDKNGCAGSTTLPNAVTVSGPSAKFAPDIPGGCTNTTVTFKDSSTSTVGIRQWLWNFGDGSVQNYTAAPFSHQYTKDGIFAVRLTITDASGCTDTASSPIPISITKPRAGFKADKNVFCPGVDFQFIDTSSGTNLSYAWDFGDGGTSTLSNPKHMYTGPDAFYTVKLFIKDNVGCSDSITAPNFVQILKPKAAFTFKDTSSICNLLATQFFFDGKDYTDFYWDFGDSSQSISKNPLHFYNSYGQFTATLYTIGNGGCYDSAQRIVNLYNPSTNTQVTYSPLNACNQLNVDFNLTTPPNTTFTLHFGDGAFDTTQNKILQHLYNLPGYYSPVVILKDQYDCQAAVGGSSGTIQILGALPLFNIDKKKFCDTGNVFITNYTISNDPVVSQVWDFGDGTSSTVFNPTHVYNQSGLYPVMLSVTTQAGCNSSLSDTVRIYKTPDPSIVSPDEICVNTSSNFNGILSQPDTAITWGWDFGDGRNSPAQNNFIAYNKVGTYTINLQAVNLLGCKGTDTKPLIVHPNPTIQTKNVTIPLKGSVILPVSYSGGISTYTWQPPAGLSCTDCANPVATPQFTTNYHVAVIDSNSCTASADLLVTVVCSDKNYFVPNTFSPNGDGMNDVFYPRGNALTRIAHMQIFNRWGQLIFERRDFSANDPGMGWDGKVNGQLAPEDVYVYIIDFICENSQIVPYKGNVALIR